MDYLRQNGVQVEEVMPSGNRYEYYTLPGGENYRELLLTLPGAKPLNWDNIGKIMQKHDIPGDFAPGEHKDDVALRIINGYGSRLTKQEFDYLSQSVKTRGYTSSHWDEPNVLAHVRFNDRTGANGEKVLHIEEVQSDWHQAGRQKGYRTDTASLERRMQKLEKEIAELNKQNKEWELDPYALLTDAVPEPYKSNFKKMETLNEEYNNLEQQLKTAKQGFSLVPDAPCLS